MPGGDGTGPLGLGPMAGRGFGRCVGAGRGAGWGRGRGRGAGWGMRPGPAGDGREALDSRIGWLEELVGLLKQRRDTSPPGQ